ncbi:hypothetical protein NDU88_001322 [Pleurodeles waltl]|uniref:Uncharacterized protein n=1 Tax=Pleurodeles waltl TaxID=8319 RepID=A0AAV7U789_PLEWA|nr:hypothetical protein NDU88_001322 [Pleurodeles waltl]
MMITSSNTLTQMKPQGSSARVTALVHVPTIMNRYQSTGQQNTQLITAVTDKPHSLQLPITLENMTDAPTDSLFIRTRQQSTPMLQESPDTQGFKRRLEAFNSLSITELEDSWLHSISVTNDKDPVKALDLKTVVLPNIKAQHLDKSQRLKEANQCSTAPQQKKVSTTGIQVSNGWSDLHREVDSPTEGTNESINMDISGSNTSLPDTNNRENPPIRKHLAGPNSCTMRILLGYILRS